MERERIEFLESEKRYGTLPSNMTRSDVADSSYKTASLPKNMLPIGSDIGDKKEGDKKEGGNSKGKGKGKKTKEKKKQVDKKKSSDDTDIVLRRKESSDLSMSQRKTQTLSFRSELANRIVVQAQRLSRSSMDLTVEQPLEVEVLYENLLDDDLAFDIDGTSRTPDEKEDAISLSAVTLRDFPKDMTLAPPSTSSGILKPIGHSPTSTSQSSVDSSTYVNNSTLPSDSLGSRAKTGNSTMRTGTVRKGTSCNAVIVLSGGDGYQDLDHSRSKSGGDDACILLWIYKF